MSSTLLWKTAPLVVLALSPAFARQEKASDTLTPLHVAQTKSVRSADLSPDGEHVAFVRAVPRTPGEDEDGSARSELHVLDVATGASRPYVTADSGVSAVAWTPDGTGITFLAKREGDAERALYLLPLAGGEARRALMFADRGIASYELAPDGVRVAVLAAEPASDEREKQEKKGFKQEVYEEDWRPTQLWIGTLFDDEAKPELVPLDAHASSLTISPDGTQIALSVAPTALVDDSYTERSVMIVNVATKTVTGTIANEGKFGQLAWSPDGRGIALVAALDAHDGAANRLLWAPVPTDGATVTPTPLLAPQASNAPERDEHEVAFLPDGRLVVRGSQGAWSTLDAYSLKDGRAVERQALVELEGPVWGSFSLSEDGRRAALVGATPTHPNEVFTLELGSGELARRTDSNPWLASIRFATQEVVRYPARDGLEVEGVLIRPRDVEGPAPTLVVVHGGPEAHLSNGWLTRYSYPGQMAAARGYAVFYPNYRGSTGRGLGYLKKSQGDPAGKEFDDIVDGVDWLVENGVADKDRVGITGGSYGGYATAWCSTYYSDRFAAGVMFVGISNKISKVGTTDIPDEEYLVHAMKRPWDDWSFFLERSPIFHADKSKTPLLILHGKDDPRVDPGQSREMYRHLKLRGQAPVRLVQYPGEGHGNRKAAAQFDYSLRMLRWFDHFLKGEGGEAPDSEIDYSAYLGQDDEKKAVEAGY